MIKLVLTQKFKSLDPLSVDLPNFVLLTGINGAGKTQLLTAIIQQIMSVTDTAGSELNPKKYVSSQTLSPNETEIITREKLNNDIKTIWDRFNQYLQNKETNPYYNNLENLGISKPQIKLIDKIAKSANKSRENLTSDDFFNNYPVNDGLNQSDVFYQNFANLFKRYQDKLDENNYREYRNQNKQEEIAFLTKEEFIGIYGEAPWEFVNKIIKEADLDYHISSPLNSHRDAPFELKLVNNFNNAEIQFSDLSSGEKVLMSLALALYNSNSDIEFPQVLLMDEPDASLHPSMSKKFLDVIQNVFVNEKKVKVIITTHSPSTVALAPEESIFIVNKTDIRIEKVSKDKALKILTSGVPSFSVNYENRRQVFVESSNDVKFYELLYGQLSNYLVPEISLSFISSGESRTDKNGIKISNCDQVKNITDTLINAGNKFVSGIIDWDSKNISTQNIKVIGNGKRYSIENYILDPLLIAALLLREKLITKEELGMNQNENYMDFKHFDSEKLQHIANQILLEVAKIINPTNDNSVSVKLVNGIEINLPIWYLHHQGHSLEEQLLKAYPKLNEIKKGKEEALKIEILRKVTDEIIEIVPLDILQVLYEVQQS